MGQAKVLGTGLELNLDLGTGTDTVDTRKVNSRARFQRQIICIFF